MRRVGRNDDHRARTTDPGRASDGDLQLAVDHVPDLLLHVVMPVDGRVLVELPPYEGVVLRMKEPPPPTGALVEDRQLLDIDEHGVHDARRHGNPCPPALTELGPPWDGCRRTTPGARRSA